ncbi:Serine/threonine protein kinase [Handroanthus impetiginosus]|uniref:Serine/threonine protein kinase n=1 Tax=Handroanthus impetiginosus TaxID=429701 RepID=A0A2G9IA28_9LAMI|nr:Serine/threonine protein kinase [Handroanthus impetiginosus]
MKRDKQYFMGRLSCGISSMKSNNTLKQLRGPVNQHVSYDEMIPSYSSEDLSPSNIGNTMNTKQSISKDKSHSHIQKPLHNDQNLHQLLNIDESNGIQMEEFQNPICSICKNRRPKIGLHRDFTYKELHEATEGFSNENFLSEGGFGFVFKGKLKDGLKIAVKQHKPASLQGEKQFKSEVYVLSQARHQNVVVLLGSCVEGSHRLLVYEYVCSGSLEERLSGDGSWQPLNWEQRLKIAMGAAKGLAYLHGRNIVHRDMRPSNILITHDHESLLGDFGLAKEQQEGSLSSSGVVGTLGYLAPEYAESGKLSTKTDVYSFGVVLLQLITGLKTTDAILGGKSLVGWAKPLLETKNYPDLIDKRILDFHDVHKLFWMVLVAEKCLKKNPDDRWTMEQVVHNLNCIKEGNTNFIIDF